MKDFIMATLNYADFFSVLDDKDTPAFFRYKKQIFPLKEGATYTEANLSPLDYGVSVVEMNETITDFEKMVCDYFSREVCKGLWYPELANYKCQLLKLPCYFNLKGSDLDHYTIPSLYWWGEVVEISLPCRGATKRKLPLGDVLCMEAKVSTFQGVEYRRARLKDGSKIDIQA